MTVFIVNYDLRKPEQDYDDLHDALESYRDYHHSLQSFWLVDADTDDASEIRDDLKEHIDSSDSLVVLKKCDSGITWATNNASDTGTWLEQT